MRLHCSLPSPSISYPIEITQTVDETALAQELIRISSQAVIITDDHVAPLYGDPLCRSLCSQGLETFVLSFPPGEHHKTQATKAHLEDQLFERGLGRDLSVIALGGGIVLDLAGFLAATWCRGVPLIMVPTTLLAMVDACIGGKTGVNTPFGKNLIGSIYQPHKVHIPLSTLHTLPPEELKNGVVEMIKHALIADATYFESLEKQTLNSLHLQEAIASSCLIKKEIVSQDEKESGKRRLLNFGHTIGHALEHLTDYRLTHGEAVAIGILAESHLALQLGVLPQECFQRIHTILKQYGLPLKLPFPLPLSDLFWALSRDKKSLKGQPRFVIIEQIGSPLSYDHAYCTPIADPLLSDTLKWMNHALRCH